MVKNGPGQSGQGTLKLAYLKNEYIEWTGILHSDTNSGKLKFTLMSFGRAI